MIYVNFCCTAKLFIYILRLHGVSQVAQWVKNPPVMQETQKHRFNPWVRKIPWRTWQPTPILLPGESHGKRSLAGYSPWSWRIRHDLVTKPSSSTRTAYNYVHLAKANKISNYSNESIKILVLLTYVNFYPTAWIFVSFFFNKMWLKYKFIHKYPVPEKWAKR